MTVQEAIALGRAKEGCSDVHIIANDPVKLRVSGRTESLEKYISTEDVESFLSITLEDKKQAQLRNVGACDVMVNVDGDQVRLHAHKEQRGTRIAIRLTGRSIPLLSKLGLPKQIGEWTERTSGLILVCGPSGSGKTTLLAAMIDRINSIDRGAIVTIERPVEYIHSQRGLYVSQIEVGRNVNSFEAGIKAALQSDPDILMIGEVNDPESAKVMMTATETGHLVLASLHSQDTIQALDRMATWGGRAAQIQLTHTLLGIVALRLVPGVNGDIIPASEILVMNDAIRKMVREERLHQIRQVMDSSSDMQTMEKDLKRLVTEGLIDIKTAKRYAPRPEEM